MDLNKLLSSVSNINDYISATEELQKCENLEIPLTMSMIHNLKKNRSLEIEFFNKCEGNGITFLVFRNLLKQPTSQRWHLLGKELIPMVHYWLEAVRKHLIIHNSRWWSFLETLLIFIQDIKIKDRSLTNTLVEQTVECLLDLACNNRMDEIQRDKVLRCVNQCSVESSRELRNRMADRLNPYFVKLASTLAGCGHLPTQMSIMELLLRWLVRRHAAAERRRAACAWFPSQLFSRDTIEIFLDASWREFFQDARRFLNSHNIGREPPTVLSVLCGEFSVGRSSLFHAPAPDDCIWLDLNYATKSITVYLDLRIMEDEADSSRLDMLTVTEDNTLTVELTRESGRTMLAVQTILPPRLTFNTEMRWAGDRCHLRARIIGDPHALDAALRTLFHVKYLGFIDCGTPSSTFGKPKSVNGDSATRRYRSGYAVRSRDPLPWSSPSTASTTSLAQLRGKLTALPPLQYNKVTPKISVAPDLPVLKEVSEQEDLANSLLKLHRCGVAVKYLSDSEAKSKPTKRRTVSPDNKENSASLLLVTTLGTTDDTIVNDTFDKVYRNNPGVDLLNLLVEEALQNGQEKDSGVVSGKRTQETDVVENTPKEKNHHKKLSLKRTVERECYVITDESDTDVIEDTPCYVSERRKTVKTSASKKVYNTVIGDEVMSLNDEVFEEFFSRHDTDKAGKPFVSPTLARKINGTSSETSDGINIDGFDIVDLVSDEEVVECLNSIIDKVCSEIEKCTNLIEEHHQHQYDSLTTSQRRDKSSNIASNITKKNESVLAIDNTTNPTQDTKKITLKFQKSKSITRVRKMNAKQKKGKQARDKKPSNVEENNISTENTSANSPVNNKATVLTRKRKLYSRKDDDNDDEIPRAKSETRQSNICDTSIAACYKELEKARKTQTRLSRKTRSSTDPLVSPKTKNLNDLFDQIKDNVVNNEEVTLVKRPRNKKDVFNISSDSDSEDFKKKKIQKRISSSSLESSVAKRGRKIKRVKPTTRCEYNSVSNSEDEVKRAKRSKRVKNIKPRSRKVNIEPNVDLIDERMRVATPEVLETSFIRQTANHALEVEEPDPALTHAPVMETLPANVNDVEQDTVATENIIVSPIKCQVKIKKEKGIDNKTTAPNKRQVKIKQEKGTSKKIEKHTKTLTKKDKTLNKKDIDKDVPKEKDSATVSPLPGLVVETEQSRKDDFTSSIEANLLQKFKNIYTEVQDLNETDRTENMLTVEDFNDAAVGPNENLENIEALDVLSEKSISTVGRSPITGHNDFDEPPPNVKSLEETIEHRNLDIQGMSRSLADFFVEMRNQRDCEANTVPEKTSPVLPITRTSTRERASVKSNSSIPRVVLNKLSSEEIDTGVNQIASPKSGVSLASNKSTRKLDATTMTSDQKDTNPNPVATAISNASSPKVLVCRMSPDEIEKYSSPVTPTTPSTKSVSVVLERISSDEIDKWLPLPKSKDVKEKPKKYNTRQGHSKPTGVTKGSPDKVERKIKSVISPIKLNFGVEMTSNENLRTYKTRSSNMKLHTTSIDNDDEVIVINSQNPTHDKNISPIKLNLGVEVTSNEKLRPYKTRSSNIKLHTTSIDNEDEIIVINSQNPTHDKNISPIKLNLGVEVTSNKNLRPYKTLSSNIKLHTTSIDNEDEIIVIDKNPTQHKNFEKTCIKNDIADIQRLTDTVCSQENTPKSSTVIDKLRKDTVVASVVASEDTSEISRSVASVNDWFNKNANSSARADINVVLKEIEATLMEKVETTLAEKHQSMVESLSLAFLEFKKDKNELVDDMMRRIRELENKHERRVCEVLRSDAEKDALMAKMLKEDLQAILDSFKQNK